MRGEPTPREQQQLQLEASCKGGVNDPGRAELIDALRRLGEFKRQLDAEYVEMRSRRIDLALQAREAGIPMTQVARLVGIGRESLYEQIRDHHPSREIPAHAQRSPRSYWP